MEWLILLGWIVGAGVVVLVFERVLQRLFRRNPVVEEWGPRAIDPNHPPYYKQYSPKPGRPQLRCTNAVCFRNLEPGEIVLFWPLKDGAYDLFCSDCWRVKK